MMDAEQFKAWRTRMGISERAAAAALYVSIDTIRGYADWSLIPDEIEERCAYLANHDAPPTGPIRERTDALRARVFALYPDFEGHFDDAMAYGITRAFTPHGLLSEFSSHYLAQPIDHGAADQSELFASLEAILAADPGDSDPLANAVATCFLENIAGSPVGEASLPFMGPASRAYFLGWHDPSRA